jgi:hypothetical protein
LLIALLAVLVATVRAALLGHGTLRYAFLLLLITLLAVLVATVRATLLGHRALGYTFLLLLVALLAIFVAAVRAALFHEHHKIPKMTLNPSIFMNLTDLRTVCHKASSKNLIHSTDNLLPSFGSPATTTFCKECMK